MLRLVPFEDSGGCGRCTRIPGHTFVNLCLSTQTQSLSLSGSPTHITSFLRLIELELLTCHSLGLECPPRQSM